MLLFRHRNDLSPCLLQLKTEGRSIGFVPTMGALHEGHLSLIQSSKAGNAITVCSIFVNPTQFNDAQDLEKYPRPVERDMELLIEAGCDILYLPSVEDVYGTHPEPAPEYDFGGIDKRLEGASRPGHFAGVAQVVRILLEITRPSNLYLGQKDYQQLLILTRLVEILGMPVQVNRCAIFREPNGLAMSSRNARLSPDLREKAGIIYATLQEAATRMQTASVEEVKQWAIARLNAVRDFRVDYFEILDARDLSSLEGKQGNLERIIITSVIVGGVRLLDNLLV